MWLCQILLLLLFGSSSVKGCGGSGVDTLAISLGLRVGGLFESLVPYGSWFSTSFWMFYDTLGSDGDIKCYIEKYIREYHHDRIISRLGRYTQDLKADQADPIIIEKVLTSFEDSNNMASVDSSTDQIQAAIFPLIIPWAGFHLGIYKELTRIYTSGQHKNTKKLRDLKKRQKQRSEAYTKKMLSYYRMYRDVQRKENSKLQSISSWSPNYIHDTAYEYVSQKHIRNILDVPGGNFEKLLHSCQIHSGDLVAFRTKTGEALTGYCHDWLSCWVSGSTCKMCRKCPGKYMTFEYDAAKYQFGYKCRGEVFWIYSEHNLITECSLINIQYSAQNNKAYWLSGAGRYGLDTKTCPGETFQGIKSNCGSENFSIYTRGNINQVNKGRETDCNEDGIYDGATIQVQNSYYTAPNSALYKQFHGEIFKERSACRVTYY